MEGCLMEKLVQRLGRDEQIFSKKLMILGYARDCGNNAKAWREFEVPKSSFYLWKKAFEREGRAGGESRMLILDPERPATPALAGSTDRTPIGRC